MNTLISQGITYDEIYFSSIISRHSPKQYIDSVSIEEQSAKIKINDGLLSIQSQVDEQLIDYILYDNNTADGLFIQTVADQLLKFELDVILQEYSGIETMLVKSKLLPSIDQLNCHSLSMMRRLFSFAFSNLNFEVFSKLIRKSSSKKIFRLAKDQLSGHLTLGRFSTYLMKVIEINIYAEVAACQSKLNCLERVLSVYRESFINHQIVVYSVPSKSNYYGRAIKTKILSRSKLDYRRVKVYERIID